MTIWRVVVDFLLPPPLVLSALLLVPLPRVISKGLLSFAKNVLFFQVAGGVKLVHFMVLITGLMLIGAAIHTHHLRSNAELDLLDMRQQLSIRAHIWREERNFWISVLTFLLWGLLARIYALMLEHVSLQDKVQRLEAQLAAVQKAPKPPLEGVPAPKPEEPSAPEVPEPRADVRSRGKNKDA